MIDYPLGDVPADETRWLVVAELRARRDRRDGDRPFLAAVLICPRCRAVDALRYPPEFDPLGRAVAHRTGCCRLDLLVGVVATPAHRKVQRSYLERVDTWTLRKYPSRPLDRLAITMRRCGTWPFAWLGA